MQEKSASFRGIASFLAVFFVVLFLTAKIPSSHCHCNDPIKSKKEACPFGALRSLAFVTPESVQSELLVNIITAAPVNFIVTYSIAKVRVVSTQARSPPSKI